jgi:hypothetical protein
MLHQMQDSPSLKKQLPQMQKELGKYNDSLIP